MLYASYIYNVIFLWYIHFSYTSLSLLYLSECPFYSGCARDASSLPPRMSPALSSVNCNNARCHPFSQLLLPQLFFTPQTGLRKYIFLV